MLFQEAERLFIEIGQAYDILGDAEKRKQVWFFFVLLRSNVERIELAGVGVWTPLSFLSLFYHCRYRSMSRLVVRRRCGCGGHPAGQRRAAARRQSVRAFPPGLPAGFCVFFRLSARVSVLIVFGNSASQFVCMCLDVSISKEADSSFAAADDVSTSPRKQRRDKRRCLGLLSVVSDPMSFTEPTKRRKKRETRRSVLANPASSPIRVRSHIDLHISRRTHIYARHNLRVTIS